MADKIDMLKSSYFLSGMNEKVYKSLCQLMDIKTHQFGDIVVDWGKPISRMYFVKEGSVKILRKKLGVDPDSELVKQSVFKSGQESIKTMKNVAKFLLDSQEYDEIALREKNQTFGEEYFYLDSNTKFRAVVDSAHATIVSIPFADMRKTFTTFEMYKQVMSETIVNKTTQQMEWRRGIDVRLSGRKELDQIQKNAVDNPLSHEAKAAKQDWLEQPTQPGGKGNKIIDILDNEDELQQMEKRLDEEEAKIDKVLTQKEKIQFANKISKSLPASQVAQMLKGNHPLTMQLKWSPHKSKMLVGLRKNQFQDKIARDQLLEERCRRPPMLQSFELGLPKELQISSKSLKNLPRKTMHLRPNFPKPGSISSIKLRKAESLTSRELDQDDHFRRYPDPTSTNTLKAKILAKRLVDDNNSVDYKISKARSNISSVILGNTPRQTVFFTKDISIDSVKQPQNFLDQKQMQDLQPGQIEEAASPLFGSRHKPSASEDMLRASFRDKRVLASKIVSKHHVSSVSTRHPVSRGEAVLQKHFIRDCAGSINRSQSPTTNLPDLHQMTGKDSFSSRPLRTQQPVIVAGISPFLSNDRDAPATKDTLSTLIVGRLNDSTDLQKLRSSRINHHMLGRLPMKPSFSKSRILKSLSKFDQPKRADVFHDVMTSRELVLEGNSLTAGWEGPGSRTKEMQFGETSDNDPSKITIMEASSS